MRTLLTAALLVFPLPALAQSGAYRDPVAAELVARSREAKNGLGGSISSYTAIVRHRSAAHLRLPLRDRLLGSSEDAARIHWSRDGEVVVQVLASRDEDGAAIPMKQGAGNFINRIFDPSGDRVYLPLAFAGIEDDDEMYGLHPLSQGAEAEYEYASGDTITMRFGDRAVRAVQLNVFPRTASFQHFASTLWIEPETGAIVQASYRPSRSLDLWKVIANDDDDLRFVPGALRDLEFEFESLIVQYSLWDFEHWLPRTTRIEGYLRAGGIRVAFADETSYEIEEVIDDDAAPARSTGELLAAWTAGEPMREVQGPGGSEEGRVVRIFTPTDSTLLARSDLRPPPIWESSPDFISPRELGSIVEEVRRAVPRGAISSPLQLTFAWGLGGPGLVRYNRVEGLSVGARLTATQGVSRADLTVRAGSTELTPGAELLLGRQMWGRTLNGSAYHQLLAVDPTYLGVGNTLSALLTGRDGGQYYRGTGVRVSAAPSAEDRPWYRLDLFAERHTAVERQTTWSVARLLGSENDLRDNIRADGSDVAGAALVLSPWWGRSASAPQGGIEYFVEAATGDFEFVRSSATLRGLTPIGPTYRIALETGAGTSWGELPVQSNWYLGGSRLLRGYDPGAAVGSSFVRGRAEVSRSVSSVGVALFGDAGWAGDRNSFDREELLYSAGVGATVFDGLLRFDVVRALSEPTGWSVELYLDALL